MFIFLSVAISIDPKTFQTNIFLHFPHFLNIEENFIKFPKRVKKFPPSTVLPPAAQHTPPTWRRATTASSLPTFAAMTKGASTSSFPFTSAPACMRVKTREKMLGEGEEGGRVTSVQVCICSRVGYRETTWVYELLKCHCYRHARFIAVTLTRISCAWPPRLAGVVIKSATSVQSIPNTPGLLSGMIARQKRMTTNLWNCIKLEIIYVNDQSWCCGRAFVYFFYHMVFQLKFEDLMTGTNYSWSVDNRYTHIT